MGAGIEWLTGILRVGPEFEDYGDQYRHSGTVILDGKTLTIKGMSASLEGSLLDEREEIRKLLLPMGVKWVVWERRRKSGKVKHIEMKITEDVQAEED